MTFAKSSQYCRYLVDTFILIPRYRRVTTENQYSYLNWMRTHSLRPWRSITMIRPLEWILYPVYLRQVDLFVPYLPTSASILTECRGESHHHRHHHHHHTQRETCVSKSSYRGDDENLLHHDQGFHRARYRILESGDGIF